MGTKLSERPQLPRHPNNIRKAIERSCWKFYQVAEQTTIPRETLVDYCAGKYPVPSDRLQALAQFLHYPPEYLVPPLPNVRNGYQSHSQSEEAKDLEVLLVLRTYCQQHPIDENALQQLMELLGKVGRYREAEQCYERFLKELKKEDPWGKPDAYTTELLTQLREQKALASEKGGQAAQTNEAALKDPVTHEPETSALPQTSSSDQKEEPPSPSTTSPAIPSDTETTTASTRETGTQNGTIQVVFITSPYWLDRMTKDGGSFSPSDSHIEGIIPTTRVLGEGDGDTDPLRRKLGVLFKQAAQVSVVSALAPEFLGRPDLLERLERAMTRPSLIDTTFLGELRSSVTNCYKLLPEIVGMVSSEHLNTVHTHLAYLIELLESSLYPSVRKPLTSLAAECSFIIGIMYHSMHLPTVAERYFTTARTVAEEADNLALKAVIHGRMSMLPEHSLTLVQEALPLAKKYGTDTTYSWLQARSAEVYAEHLSNDGQYVTECEKALVQATTFSPKGDPENDPYWTCFDECLMYGYQGVCYVKLRKPEAAKTALLQALQLSNPQNTYDQIDLQINLARVYQLQDDMINACLCGHRALSLISRTHSAGHLQGLEDFRSNFRTGQTDVHILTFDEHKKSVEELLRKHTHREEKRIN